MSRAFLKVVLKIKIKLNFIFTILCGASKSFMKVFKAFIKPFEVPQRSVKIKFNLIFSLLPGLGWEGLNCPSKTTLLEVIFFSGSNI